MLRSREKGQRGDAWGSRGIRILEDFIRGSRPQESAHHLFGDLPGREFGDSSIQDGRGEERVRHAKTAGLGIKDLAHQLHSLGRKRLRIAQPDDEQLLGPQAAFRRSKQECLAEFAAEQVGVPDTIEQAL